MQKKILSPEEQVIEALQRIEPLGIPFCAVYVAMSKLQPDNRGYRQLEIVSKLFEPLLNHAQARLFLLSNNDFLLLTANPVLDVIDDILYQIKGLFADDFFISSQGRAAFQHIFFLNRDKDELLKLLQAETSVAKTEEAPKQRLSVTPSTQELSPEILEQLLYKIEQSNTQNFIRRQTIVSFNEKGTHQEFGQEFFTSLAELQNTFAPHLNVTADKALFSMLMDTLDRRMMSALCGLNFKRFPPLISLNLNVQSVFLPIFDKMLSTLQSRLMVEFQMADILHNLPQYRKACTKLKQAGVVIALDGVGVNELEFVPMTPFDVDCYKIFWSPKLKECAPLLKRFLKEQKDKTIILARSGSEDALIFGKEVGIELFQGHFVDTLLAAVSKNACTFGQECSLSDCRLRHSVVCGSVRLACVHEAHLDAYIPLKEAKI